MLARTQTPCTPLVDGSDLLLVVGMQKSGTTLLMRLLEHSGAAVNPFDAEGDDFWGNTPPFSPTGFPAGHTYAESNGESGHLMTAVHATSNIIQVIRERYAELSSSRGLRFNKNPYNTLRLPWLRAVFPRCRIVAMVRDPVANVFSMLKKYQPHEGRGLEPSEGWWGVKPPGWRSMIREDKIEQCALQWREVNRVLADHGPLIDLVISYQELCHKPRQTIAAMLSLWPFAQPNLDVLPESMQCMDEEHARGASLRSKNAVYLQTGRFDLPESVTRELAPLTTDQIARIREVCEGIASRFEALR